MSNARVMVNNVRVRYLPNARVRRDQKKRELVLQSEMERRACLCISRNTSLPAQLRYKAQLNLNALTESFNAPVSVKDRCTETGRGRGMSQYNMSLKKLNLPWTGVISKFGLSRVGGRLLSPDEGGSALTLVWSCRHNFGIALYRENCQVFTRQHGDWLPEDAWFRARSSLLILWEPTCTSSPLDTWSDHGKINLTNG